MSGTEFYDQEDEQHPEYSIDGAFTDVGDAYARPPTWIIKDLLPTGLVFIGAPPKSYKSTLTTAMALLIGEYGCKALPPFLSIVERPGRVMAFSAEATAGDIRHICEKGLGTVVDPNEGFIVCDDPWIWRLDDKESQARLMDWLHDKQPRLVIIDPLSEFHQLDENSAKEMVLMFRPLRDWAIQHESAVVVVHHTTKSPGEGKYHFDTSHLRGSGAIFGKADGCLILTGQDDLKVYIKAVFKRAPGWARTVHLAAYHRLGMRAGEVLHDADLMVRDLVLGGMVEPEKLQKQTKMDQRRLQETLDKLVRNGDLECQSLSLVTETPSRTT